MLSLGMPRLDKENRMELEPGATNTLTVVVDESMTADRFGNTGVHVLATPMLVSYFELTAHQLAMRALEPGQGTVGFLSVTLRGVRWVGS
jgi:predicted thioesterase